MMKRTGLVAGTVAMVLALAGVGPAEAAPPIKVGVIDRGTILERTNMGKRVLEEIRAFSASRQKIIAADDQELKRLETELREQDPGVSEDVKREKQEKFRSKLDAYQRRVKEFNQEIQDKQKVLADDFQRKIDEVASAVAHKAGYAMLLDKGNNATLRIVLYHRESIDLTDDVVKEFDKRYK